MAHLRLPRAGRGDALRGEGHGEYVDDHLYNIQCSEICTLRNEHVHTLRPDICTLNSMLLFQVFEVSGLIRYFVSFV